MFSCFQHFKTNLNEKSIWIENQYLNNIFQRFSYKLFMKSNQDLLLQIKEIIQIQQQSKLKTLYISEYIPKKQQCGIDSEFLIICIENMLIIIEETELKKLLFIFFGKSKFNILLS